MSGRNRPGPRAGLLLALLLVTAGCSTGPAHPVGAATSAVPFAGCGTLTAPPTATEPAAHPSMESPTAPVGPVGTATTAAGSVGTATAPAGPVGTATVSPTADAAGSASARHLPDLTLPCLAGGPRVRLADLRGPAVINLWAAWCAPCRRELPAFQRLATRAGGSVRVIGVDTRDDRDDAAGLAQDLGVTFPTLADQDEALRIGVGGRGLPSTLLIDAAGRLRYLHDSGALDDAALTDLVWRQLGVRVPS